MLELNAGSHLAVSRFFFGRVRGQLLPASREPCKFSACPVVGRVFRETQYPWRWRPLARA